MSMTKQGAMVAEAHCRSSGTNALELYQTSTFFVTRAIPASARRGNLNVTPARTYIASLSAD